jgi:ribosomal protein S18 acetylase RimI-like enzyme
MTDAARAMTVRRAGPEDYEAIAEMWREFDHEIPPPIHEGPADQEKELAEVTEILASEVAYVAEEDGIPVGFALARRRTDRLATLTDLYVRQDARRSGVATELMRQVLGAVRSQGAELLDLEVMASNTVARSLYARWGFRDEVVVMTQSVADLEARLGRQEAGSFGSIHVQSDDLSAVEQAVRQFVPRLPGGSRGSLVAPPSNGWIAVWDDVCDRHPEMLRRLARELSDRMGAVALLLGVEREELVRMILFERGSVVDEYLSVPEFYGPLPPGDVIGLAANPTVVTRLTGADPEAVRRIARTASAPADLPPARELLAELAAMLGVEGVGHGWADAPELPGLVRVERA